MFRYLATAIFIIPKLIVWPLIWLYRCRLKKSCPEGSENPEEHNEGLLLTEED